MKTIKKSTVSYFELITLEENGNYLWICRVDNIKYWMTNGNYIREKHPGKLLAYC